MAPRQPSSLLPSGSHLGFGKGQLSVDLGLRRGELASLNLEHLDLEAGTLAVRKSLSTLEMELVAWVLGRWQADRPADGRVTFSLRECAREFGTRWGGSRGEFLKEALRRIDRTRLTSRVWNATSRKHVMRHFGIFDEVETVDYRDSFDGPSFEPGTVTVKLSGFLVDQLAANQLDKLNWAALRRGIKSPLGKRLYVFLRSQEGFPTADGLRFNENGIDRELTSTLGVRDAQFRRVRSKLTRAGQEIVHRGSWVGC